MSPNPDTAAAVRSIDDVLARAARLRAQASERLVRLEDYLRQDPRNPTLAVDVFETALRAGKWARARAVLEATQSMPGLSSRFEAARTHNLAYLDLRQRDFEACIARLTPIMEAACREVEAESSLRLIWLRALHHANQLERAIAWASKAESRGALDIETASVASLIALDAGHAEAAQRWSTASIDAASRRAAHAAANDASVDEAAVDEAAQCAEAWVVRASLALADRDVQGALACSDEAIRCRANDGRSWSSRAFAKLLGGTPEDLVEARGNFELAVRLMPAHIGTWHGKAWTELLMHDLHAARLSFDAAMALDRGFAETHGGLAVVLAMQGHRLEAEGHVQRALRLDPANVSGHYANGLLRGELKRPEDVQALAKRLLGSRPAPLGRAGTMAAWFD